MPPSQHSYLESVEDGVIKEPKETGSRTILIKLSNKNKQCLPDYAYQSVLERRPEAEKILLRLSKLNTELAQQFVHKETAFSELKLRMICSIDAAIVENIDAHVHSFLVISYCRRNPSWNPVPAAEATIRWG
jgi:hypothetical protein